MSQIYDNNDPKGRIQNSDAGILGFGGLIGIGFAVGSIWTVFTASPFAGGALVAVIAALILFATLVGNSKTPSRAGLVLILVAGVWAAFAGFIVFEWHWLAFTPAAWVFDGLFLFALLAGAWRALKAWARKLAALFAASLVAATILLPRPAGGEGPFDTAKRWKIQITAMDQADNARLEDAQVLCGTVMRWRNRLSLAETGARTTDSDGRATWEFNEDPRLKIVICTVWKNANETNAGYPGESQVVLAPAGGGEHELTFALDENPHPDTAFLALELLGTYQSHEWYYLDFEVWRGAAPGEFGAREGPQPLMRRSWHEMRGRGFTLNAADTRQSALRIRYRYEGPAAGPDLRPPYSEIRTFIVGPILGGTRRRIALSIPDGQAAN
jgi:hypothetical protein